MFCKREESEKTKPRKYVNGWSNKKKGLQFSFYLNSFMERKIRRQKKTVKEEIQKNRERKRKKRRRRERE